MQKYQAKVAKHEVLVSSFHYLHLELLKPHRIEFQAGQYIILTIDEEKGIRRNYSVASLSSMNHAIELLVNVKPQGPGSRYLESLKPGEQVEFIGPFGNFIVEDRKQIAELLFVATGSGIAPIRAMILDQLITKKITRPIRLWWGMRYQKDCFWVEDFDVLEKEQPNFKWDLCLSKPLAGWWLHSGHVTEHVLDYVKNNAKGPGQPLAFYLCGSQEMIEELSTNLKEAGIKDGQIHFEKFF